MARKPTRKSSEDVRAQIEAAIAARREAAERQVQDASEQRKEKLVNGLKRIPVNWNQEVQRGTIQGATDAHTARNVLTQSAYAGLAEILKNAGPMPDGY